MANIILVDSEDREIGRKEKMAAHIDGNLHRAFSVVLYNSRGEIFIHKRALSKYHCGGLWTNACCSHPFPGENTSDAAERRLFEELGFRDINLTEKFVFSYRTEFPNGIIENEIDHVFTGCTDSNPPNIDPEEVAEYQWIEPQKLIKDINKNPVRYTVWFKEIINRIYG